MKTLVAITLVSMLGTPWLPLPPRERAGGEGEGADPVAHQAEGAATFATIDITIDPLGQPLAAYQFELTATDASFTVVGVEAGDHPAFDHGRPPYFDRTAEHHNTDRLILAEYALPSLDAEQLPTQAIRVATIHVMLTGTFDNDALPAIELTLITAGDADGKPIDAKLSHTLQVPERPE